jgi:copper chaperone NosL
MKNTINIVVVLAAVFFSACTTKTEPMNYGKDNCSFCKMGIIDPKYGAELVTSKGKVYKFDDVICIARFLSSNTLGEKNLKHKVVINFEKENEFIDLDKASFWISPELKSPMGSNAAAFKSNEAAQKLKGDKAGELLNWNELHNKLK